MATLLSPPRHYLNDGYGITSWLLTRDHKRIALLYLMAKFPEMLPKGSQVAGSLLWQLLL